MLALAGARPRQIERSLGRAPVNGPAISNQTRFPLSLGATPRLDAIASNMTGPRPPPPGRTSTASVVAQSRGRRAPIGNL